MAAAAPLAAQCGTAGTGNLVPRFDITSDLWSSDGELRLTQALPGAHWLLAMDTQPGPLPTPFGTLCIGLSPAWSILLDSTTGTVPPIGLLGELALPLDLAPASWPLIGTTLHFQGLLADPQGPGGFALTNGLAWTLRSPRVVVSNTHVASRSLDIVDAFAATVTPATAHLDTISGQNHDDFAFSPDGRLLFTRDITYSVPDRVRCWAIQSSPPTMIGELVVSPTGLGVQRRGIVIAPDGLTGWFCDQGGVFRFDADPLSPSFMTITGVAPTTAAGPDSLAMSRDGSLLLVTSPAFPPTIPSILCVVDTTTVAEIQTVPLSYSGNLLGIVERGPIVVSPDGRYAATTTDGIWLPGYSTLQTLLSIVDIDPLSATFLTELTTTVIPTYFVDDLAFDPRDPASGTLYTVGSLFPSTDIVLTRTDWIGATHVHTVLATGSGALYPEGGVDTTPDGSTVFASVQLDGTLRVIDAATLTQIGLVALPGSGLPSRVHVQGR